jgi:hypothetical protein
MEFFFVTCPNILPEVDFWWSKFVQIWRRDEKPDHERIAKNKKNGVLLTVLYQKT